MWVERMGVRELWVERVGAVDRMGVWGLWIERHEKVKGVVTL